MSQTFSDRQPGTSIAELERAGAIETRRGVGSFVTATPEKARPAREHDKRLRAFATRVLAEAGAAGLAIDDLIAELSAQQGGR